LNQRVVEFYDLLDSVHLEEFKVISAGHRKEESIEVGVCVMIDIRHIYELANDGILHPSSTLIHHLLSEFLLTEPQR